MKQKIMKQVDFSNPSLPSPWKGEEGIVRRNDPDEILQKFHGVNRSCKNGFSINEVMISMFVLSVGIVTVIGLFSKGFINSALDRDRIVAAGLAQEGVELVKNVRDNSFAKGDADGFVHFVASSDYCRASYDSSASAMDCSNNSGDRPASNLARYTLSLSGSYYKHTNSASAKFSRYIDVDYNNGQKMADVVSFVYWGGSVPSDIENGNVTNCHIGNKCVYSKVRLENWKP
jgi:Tfp pilus assembly protein PilV